MPTPTIIVARIAVISAILVGLATLVLLRPGVALAHHIEIDTSTTCDTYAFTADYIGGSSDRVVEVRVNGVLAATQVFPGSGPDLVEDFFVLTGDLPTNTTVEIRLYVPQAGDDRLESSVSATINEDASCTPTPTPPATETPESTPTSTPEPSATPEDGATSTPDTVTSTPVSTATSTNVPTSTPAPPTATVPASTPTSVPSTSTAADVTPTFVSTVESLQPPVGPGTGSAPPQETASGLPNTGAGTRSAQLAAAVVLLGLAGSGVAFATLGMRRRAQ